MPSDIYFIKLIKLIKFELKNCLVQIKIVNYNLALAIGNATVPGLSGGEKKRANIACDLLINPLVLLIDVSTAYLHYLD